MQLAETSWLDVIGNIGSKYLDYKVQKTQTKAATQIATSQNPYSNYSNYSGYLPVIPKAGTSDNMMLYLGIGGAALIAVLLLGGKK